MNPHFWTGKRVFVTGHTGFKGSWLCLWLQTLGAEVAGYGREPSPEPCLFQAARVADGMSSTYGDIRDSTALTCAMLQARPEIVFHLAAQPIVRIAYQDPAAAFSINVMGTVNVLEAMRVTPGVRAAINVTTDKCYAPQPAARPFAEEDRLGSMDPYGSSKACSELITLSYRESFLRAQGCQVASARAGNVIGGGDWATDRLVPDLVRAIQVGSPLQLRYPASMRPWQHVLEPLHGYLMLAERLHSGPGFDEAWNFGPAADSLQPVSWVAEELARLLGATSCWQQQPGDHPPETTTLMIDSAKARDRLGWSPRWTLSQALQAVADWHQLHQKSSSMRTVCEAQISLYQA
jgi:CDP-glucose 4,6-dehydratase